MVRIRLQSSAPTKMNWTREKFQEVHVENFDMPFLVTTETQWDEKDYSFFFEITLTVKGSVNQSKP